MKNLTLLLCLAVFSVAFSKDLRKRRSSSAKEAALLEALSSDPEEGNVDLNEFVDKRNYNQKERLYMPFPMKWKGNQ
ncbi:hypothetical protein CHS0354_033397 [Potamilus streckersoni]|uniref:Uncharacterized protein n=1 Tax=Potamilus streckersoni TaxID=2493646 RepID=A0AAE0SRH5_9BIVA|nr:hypothetical protein CHS0354_033397 [Potamilus streckersoni]